MSARKSEPPPLLVAMKERNYQKVVDLLNSQGLIKDNKWIDYICLIHAILARNLDIVNLLLKNGCRVKGKPKTKKLHTPLYYAVQAMKNNKHKVLKIMEILLKAGASITDKDKSEETPLQLAVKDKRKEAVDLMLSNYDVKSVDVQSRDEKIHFVIACINNHFTLVKEFIKKGMKICTPIASACLPNLEWPNNSSLLHIVVKFKARSVLTELLNTGDYDFTLQDENQHSPLHLAYYLSKEKKMESDNWYRGNFSDIVEEILSAHTKILKNPIDNEGLSHFHIACLKGKVSLVKSFLKHGVDMKKLNQTNTESFLSMAIKTKNNELINILIQCGADINGKGSDGLSPLCLALKLKLYDVAETLLSRKADICIQDDNGNTPIHYAFFHLPDSTNDLRYSIKSLIDTHASKFLEHMLSIHQGRMSNQSNENGLSIFHIACAKSTVDIVKNFIKNKVDVNACLKKRSNKELINVNLTVGERCSKLPGSTALHFATWTKNTDVIELLLKNKADVNAVNKDGVTPVMIAIESPPTKKEVMEFVKGKVLAEVESLDDGSGSHIAGDDLLIDSIYQEFKHMEIIKLFFKENCNLNQVDKKGNPLLFRAFSKLNYVYPSFLGVYKPGTNDKNKDERISNICVSFFTDNFEKTMDLLVEHGVNLNAQDRQGNSIIHHLVKHMKSSKIQKTLMKIIEIFLEKGANAEIENNEGKLPFNQVVSSGLTKLVQLFMKFNININLADKRCGTPLHNEALFSCNDRSGRTQHHEMIKLLLANGADINSRDTHGRTAIFRACKWENPGGVMKFLLDKGAEVSILDKDGRTALFTAAINNNEKCVQLLLEYGIDINVKDKYGMSVFEKLFTYQTHTNIMEGKFDGVVTALVTHMRKLQLLGHTLNRKNLLYCKRLNYVCGNSANPKDVKDLFEEEKRVKLDMFEEDFKLSAEMKKELKKLAATSIDKHTSLHDILFKDMQQMMNYVENEKLKKYLDDKAFPHYGYLIRLKFREASRKYELLGSARTSCILLTKKKLPDSCLHNIFDYLTNKDLKNLANVRK